MKLVTVVIHKYKSFIVDQSIEIEPDITCIVGKNESGKTAILEAIAKLNYFDDDKRFKFDETFDYPKNEWKITEKPEEQEIISVTYKLEDFEKGKIEELIGKKALKFTQYDYTKKYNGKGSYGGVVVDESEYINHIIKESEIAEEQKTELSKCKKIKELLAKIAELELKTNITDTLNNIVTNSWEWDNPISGFIAKEYLSKYQPVYWYFDEYFNLPGRIDLTKVASNQSDQYFTQDNLKISKALIELSRIDINEFIKATNFEAFISELEATSNAISDELFEYWKTNAHLEIKFEIESVPEPSNPAILRKYLNVRIRNTRHRVSLPLSNRSKGFIWFFSFLVWFSKIQADRTKKYIILLDEPGLNLHASAQADLLRYINEKLAPNYQVIYTTHSPFMIESSKIHRIRTVYDTLDTKKGSIVSQSIQEKDPDTLFPLQAALGYDIAQNLFISEKNLLVEGPGDLVYFEIMKDILRQASMPHLNDDITIVPVGGLDKVTSFISLLRGNSLKIACILDTFTDQKGKKRLEDLIVNKIIKEKNILFFDQFAGNSGGISDIEDMFTQEEYLRIYNLAFPARKVEMSSIDTSSNPITKKIAALLGIPRYNHYLPAITAMKIGYGVDTYSKETISRFSKMFEEINKLF